MRVGIMTPPLCLCQIGSQRQGHKNPHQALTTLTEEVNEGLGRKYGVQYEEAQLAVRLVDFLVAKSGCDSVRPAAARAALEREASWAAVRQRLLWKWGDMWGNETVARVGRGIFERIAAEGEAPASEDPSACVGQQTAVALCSEPGWGAKSGPVRKS